MNNCISLVSGGMKPMIPNFVNAKYNNSMQQQSSRRWDFFLLIQPQIQLNRTRRLLPPRVRFDSAVICDRLNSFGHKSSHTRRWRMLQMSTWEGQMSALVWYVSVRADGGSSRWSRAETEGKRVCVCVCAGENKMVENHQSAMWPTSAFVKKIWQQTSTQAPHPPGWNHFCRFHLDGPYFSPLVFVFFTFSFTDSLLILNNSIMPKRFSPYKAADRLSKCRKWFCKRRLLP